MVTGAESGEHATERCFIRAQAFYGLKHSFLLLSRRKLRALNGCRESIIGYDRFPLFQERTPSGIGRRGADPQ